MKIENKTILLQASEITGNGAPEVWAFLERLAEKQTRTNLNSGGLQTSVRRGTPISVEQRNKLISVLRKLSLRRGKQHTKDKDFNFKDLSYYDPYDKSDKEKAQIIYDSLCSPPSFLWYSWSTKKWPVLTDTIVFKDLLSKKVLFFETVESLLEKQV